MFRPRNLPASDRRRAVILMVVLVLLTLFAVVGLAFVLYANGQVDSARSYKETAEFVSTQPVEKYDSVADYAFGQLLYGPYDPVNAYPDGACSALRGHSLNIDLYGWNSDNPGSNIYPFNGVGRLHNQITLPSPPFPPNTIVDEHNLINYTPYLSGIGGTYTATDQLIRDPERYGFRGTAAALSQALNPYTGGWNSSYTYPDGNHVYLGAYDSFGRVLARSFYRDYLIPTTWINGAPTGTQCLPLDPNAAGYWTWTSNTNPNNPNETIPSPPNLVFTSNYLKYTCLRPRPADMAPGFPAPGLGGDVKNLRGLPGPNDSIWIDLDYPVKTASNGVKYKPLFAFLIVDLDGRVNLNAHGNASGANLAHRSNQGWGKWEVNPAQLASTATPAAQVAVLQAEWPNLFVGTNNGVTNLPGRYGIPTNALPGPVNNSTIAISGKAPHFYAPVDYDATNDGQGGAVTLPLTFGTLTCFPTFPAGYGNGSQLERTNHPLLYDPLSPGLPLYPTSTNRRFGAGNLVRLYNASVLGTTNLNCEVGRLLPNNMSQAWAVGNSSVNRIPHMMTTDSYHLDRPAMSPWLWDRTATTTAFYGYGAGGTNQPSQPPTGQAQQFPSLTLRTAAAGGVPANSEFRTPGQLNYLPSPPNPANTFNPAVDWRSVDAALSKVDLNRFLPPYPHQGRGRIPAAYNNGAVPRGYDPTPLTGTKVAGNFVPDPNARFDDPNNPYSDASNNPDPDYANTSLLQGQFQAAQQARQQLADDIYRRLLLVTGVPAVVNTATPTAQELASRRWLAQLAVNIVDFIDEDEISTPFNFYNTTVDGLPAANLGATTNLGNPQETSPTYWVFGTEMPKVLINEALAEYTPPATLPGQSTVNVFVELFNPIGNPVANAGSVQAQDSLGVPLYVQAAGPNPAYSPYVVVVADNNVNVNAGTPNGDGLAVSPTTSPYNNDLVLGTYNVVRNSTDFSGAIKTLDMPSQQATAIIGGPATAAVKNPQFFLVGPGTDNHGTINPTNGTPAGVVPPGTPMLTTPNMQYTVQIDANNNWSITGLPGNINDKANGINVLLRRLVNPHLPFDARPVLAGNTPNPAYNPYVTVDYIGGGVRGNGNTVTASAVPLQDTTQTNSYYSTLKLQPYAAYPSQVITPASFMPAAGQQPTTVDTFGSANVSNPNVTPTLPAPFVQTPTYDWLFFPDRQLVNSLELLHVSGYQPHMLTRRFVAPVTQGGNAVKFAHQVNWFDETNRLYRALEFLTTRDRTTGVSPGGRVPGAININTMWDQEVFFALCDSQNSNTFNQTFNQNFGLQQIFSQMLAVRSPGYANNLQITARDRPFRSLGTGNMPANDPQTAFEDNTQKGTTTGIEDTFLRTYDGGGSLNQQRLFGVSAAAPGGAPASWTPPTYQQTELMRKIYGNVTTRSNVFAVWCTVGFFRVADDSVRPVKLAEELGASTNTNIRPRFFSVIDRSRMVIADKVATLPSSVTLFNQPITIPISGLSGTAGNNNIPWSVPGIQQPPTSTGAPSIIGPGTPSVLVIDNGGAYEETVIVEPPTGIPNLPANNSNQTIYWITATFQKSHSVGAPVTIPGNPGPQPTFGLNDTNIPGVVAAYGVLE